MVFLKSFFIWIYWHPFHRLVRLLPTRVVYLLADVGAAFCYLVFSGRRQRLFCEVDFLFDEMLTGRKAQQAVRGAFKVLVKNEFEVLLFPKLTDRNIDQYTICQGLLHLDRALDEGKGVILLFAHFGANQMVMPAMGYRGYRMNQLSAPATVWENVMGDRKFSFMERHAMQRRWAHESSLPVEHINIFGSLRRAVLCLKRNEILGVAIDGGGGKERMKITFMNKPALFSPGAATLAVRLGCVVLPTFMVRTKNGPSRMMIFPPIRPPVNVTQKVAIQVITQAFADQLTKFVWEYPDHYLNFTALRRCMSRFEDHPLFTEKEESDEFDHPHHPHAA